MAPFILRITGNATASKTADQANLRVFSSSSGYNKQTLSDQVLTTARYIEDMIENVQAQVSSTPPISYWSRTKLSVDSSIERVPRDQLQGQDAIEHSNVTYASGRSLFGINQLNPDSGKMDMVGVRRHHARIDFIVHFQDLAILREFCSHLTSVDHCDIGSVSWVQTPAAGQRCKSQLRMEAAQDARSKVVDYCRVVCSDQENIIIFPAELTSEKILEGHAWAPLLRPEQQFSGHDSTIPRQEGVYPSLTPQELTITMAVDFVFTVETTGTKQNMRLNDTDRSLNQDVQ